MTIKYFFLVLLRGITHRMTFAFIFLIKFNIVNLVSPHSSSVLVGPSSTTFTILPKVLGDLQSLSHFSCTKPSLTLTHTQRSNLTTRTYPIVKRNIDS